MGHSLVRTSSTVYAGCTCNFNIYYSNTNTLVSNEGTTIPCCHHRHAIGHVHLATIIFRLRGVVAVTGIVIVRTGGCRHGCIIDTGRRQ